MLTSHWPKLLMLIALGMSILLPVVVGLGEALRAAFWYFTCPWPT